MSISDDSRVRIVAPTLRRLSAERCAIDLAAPRPLESLALHRCDVADVARLPSTPSLTIASCGLGPDAMHALATRRELVYLDLIGNPIGDAGARILAEADLPNLKALRINDGISDGVLALLAQARRGAEITLGWDRKL